MIGQQFTYSTFPRDRLVNVCKSSAKADVFQRIIKEYPKHSREFLIGRLVGYGIEDADCIVSEIDNQIEERRKILENLVL
jgi:hypothetical protein